MSRKPLSPEAILLLRLINSACYNPTETHSMRNQYWAPSAYTQRWTDRIGNGEYWVHGMDDAARIRGLTARGLVEVVESAASKYARRITPAGKDFLGKIPPDPKPERVSYDDENAWDD